MYPSVITATTSLSGKELAYSLNFPKKSVAGFPVLECVEFGRNITTYDEIEPLKMNNEEEKQEEGFDIGNIFHMNHEEKTTVLLSPNSLTSHVFVTGSTGVGKSNAVYQILKEAKEKSIKFLVIEPAKGEYKNVFGMQEDVSVYGTNPLLMPLLKINPFSFPREIHVLEHIDRLVEIFNVCWPMYAAMPAVLKNAVEKSYLDCGWCLNESENPYGDNMYPCFADVARNIKAIIDSSEYDSENKGAYKGALMTRLKSLTNGINGMMFVSDEISSSKLFDENVVIDLSRVGSGETKSLIMGMLVLKLQEYRMTQGEMNVPLKHITVLEEAHHLLKRTSTEQSADSSNLLGKSVEMIANAIAEMRTYGESFIIADQAPGLLDMAAIRNTNTKIILRLPDQLDRELVGKAANLNDNQIKELARLRRGVAAIYQNEWIQPVLCKIKKCEYSEEQYKNSDIRKKKEHMIYSEERLKIAELLSKGQKLGKEEILKDIHPIFKKLMLDASLQVLIIKLLENPPKEIRMDRPLAPIMSALFPEVYSAVKLSYEESSDAESWTKSAENALYSILEKESLLPDEVRRNIVQAVITEYIYNELGMKAELERWSKEGGLK